MTKHKCFLKISLIMVIVLLLYHIGINPYILREYDKNNMETEIFYMLHDSFSKNMNIVEYSFDKNIFNDTCITIKGTISIEDIEKDVRYLRQSGWRSDISGNKIKFEKEDFFIEVDKGTLTTVKYYCAKNYASKILLQL